MPDINWNKSLWGRDYDWQSGGEEWSLAWGGSEAQWFGALFPRIHRLLPARHILEIAPGFGRWTKYLVPASSSYLGIDLSELCVDKCRARFRDAPHAYFMQNDGLSLDAAPDGHFDLIFSFDSLVHAEIDVFKSYIPQLVKKLSPNGVAFVHHSNLGGFDNPEGAPNHSRAMSVSGRAVADLITQSGGKLIIQELINWHSAGPIDCLTTFGRTNETTDAAVHLVNLRFTEEAANIAAFQRPYCDIR